MKTVIIGQTGKSKKTLLKRRLNHCIFWPFFTPNKQRQHCSSVQYGGRKSQSCERAALYSAVLMSFIILCSHIANKTILILHVIWKRAIPKYGVHNPVPGTQFPCSPCCPVSHFLCLALSLHCVTWGVLL